MRLYLDCFMGISGDMMLGLLLDLGVREEEFLNLLNTLPLEFSLDVKTVQKNGLSGKKVSVLYPKPHQHRHLNDIYEIIEKSSLPIEVKNKSKYAFKLLAEAEAKIHGTTMDKVHFHEVGAVDAIVDICGSILGVYLLEVDTVIASPLPLSRGFVNSAHGPIPLPAPATLELLSGIPVVPAPVAGELVTPTGAALYRVLVAKTENAPSGTIIKTGYGAGSKDFIYPNMLRGILFTENSVKKSNLVLLETNIDHLSSEALGYSFNRLFREGALDVFITPIQMKKSRPGVILSVLCPESEEEKFAAIIFSETGSLGIRRQKIERYEAEREIIKLNTRYGLLPVKIGRFRGKVISVHPEFDACQVAAQKYNVSFREVYEEVMAVWQAKFGV
ncbi:nickel pincer cofactor biosynthesis protein LarC [Carboxydothermus pertinax]|uniref:Pyridinium-3,5-bisthiocarboxylic acid mononucleotide nickel insertion protein n=1 Tax=Carboxydothermus pertinax TaxID=870242 RepID=A0A1L8CT46_9THEO|nr:nickel pincer cofactor biosynthesis protein LarC [Carboxydothermus pertinax]GAV22082.1 TIGR00299 family protein [Carboxydothermus pertinax]